jgi:hypothetical protein
MRHLGNATLILLFALVGCGGGSEEAASTEWCLQTLRIDYTVENYSSAPDVEELAAWPESSPEEIRPSIGRAAQHIGRYPVDPNDPAYMETRREIQEYVKDHCPEDCTHIRC